MVTLVADKLKKQWLGIANCIRHNNKGSFPDHLTTRICNLKTSENCIQLQRVFQVACQNALVKYHMLGCSNYASIKISIIGMQSLEHNASILGRFSEDIICRLIQAGHWFTQVDFALGACTV